MAEKYRTNSDFTFQSFVEMAEQLYKKHGYITWSWEVGATRSTSQNNALHLYCELLSKALNDSGYDMKLVLEKLSKDAEIPWTQLTVKERLWKVVQKAMTGKQSTTEPTRKEYVDIYDALNRITIENFGVSVQWPSEDR